MYQGNWKCSSCEGTITELPFQPRSELGLTCRDCWSKKNTKTAPVNSESIPVSSEEIPDDIPLEAGVASEPMPDDDGLGGTPITPGDKPKFAGDWSCAGCGTSITSLPFSPRDTSNLKCLDCFKASKA